MRVGRNAVKLSDEVGVKQASAPLGIPYDTPARYGAIQSMSGTGRCYDSARMESFFATLKKEKISFRLGRCRWPRSGALSSATL